MSELGEGRGLRPFFSSWLTPLPQVVHTGDTPIRNRIMTEQWSDSTKQLVKATVGRGLDNSSLALLEHISISKGLDPLAGELIAYGAGGKPTLITTINGMTKLCSPMLDGVDVLFYDCEGNAYPVWLPDKPPAACAVSVYRKGCARAFTASCRFQDFAGGGQPWKKMPSTMIRKCALAAALRLGFADLLAGLYAQEEMEQAGFTSMPAPADQQDVAAAAQKKPAAASAEQKRVAPRHAPARQTAEQAADSLAKATGGTVLEQIRSDPSEAWVVEEEQVQDVKTLPERDWSPQKSIQVLWDRCRELGMLPEGWLTLEKQLGGINPDIAMRIAPKIDKAKVAILNTGRPTTAAA